MTNQEITDFEKRVNDSSEKLDQLIARVSKAGNVGDLLTELNSQHAETLTALNQILIDFKNMSSSLKSAADALNTASAVVSSTEPAKIIEKLDAITGSLSTLETSLQSGLKDLSSKFSSIEIGLPSKLKELDQTIASRIKESEIKLSQDIGRRLTPAYVLLAFIAGLAAIPSLLSLLN